MRELNSSLREVAVLQEATEMILSSSDADTVLHQILLIVRNYFGVKTCTVFLVDKDTNELYVRADNGYDFDSHKDIRLKIGQEGVSGYVAQTRIPLYVPDVSKEPRYRMGDANVKSEFAVPMIVRDEVIGVLDLESDKLDFFTDQIIGLVALFAGQAAVALENARLYSTERRRMRQIEFINLIARSATAASGLDQLLDTLSDLVSDTFEGSKVSLLLRDSSGELTLQAHSAGDLPEEAPFAESHRHGVIGEALQARTNVVVNDVRERPKWKPCIEGSASELCVPLLSLGDTVGALVLSSEKPNSFSADDRSIAQAAADVCATAIRNVQLTEELSRIANTDTLTSVFNQRYFHIAVGHEISRSRRFGKMFSVLLFDLRNFRGLNEELGFDAGDDILKSVARSLISSSRSIDTVCRYGGDRFALVLPETDASNIATVQSKIAHALGSDVKRPQKATFASVQYPEDGSSELELIRHLLARLEREKQRVASAKA